MCRLSLSIGQFFDFVLRSKHRTLLLIFFILATFAFFNQTSKAEINCAYLINQQMAKGAKDRYRRGYCLIKVGRFQEGVSLLDGLENERLYQALKHRNVL